MCPSFAEKAIKATHFSFFRPAASPCKWHNMALRPNRGAEM
ncbi:hypothetical protein WJX82_004518 [Trebouxia sp. C0006]